MFNDTEELEKFKETMRKFNEDNYAKGMTQAQKEFDNKERTYPMESWKLRVGGAFDFYIIGYRKRWQELLGLTPEMFHFRYGY